jgi:DNA-binding beta-propeller fold protein YncE
MNRTTRASKHSIAITVVLFASLVVLAVSQAPAASAASPPLLRQFCPTGSAAGQCSIPRGIGVDQASGDVYVADNNNKRIEKFSPWGVFLRAWGGQGSGPSQFGNLGPQGVAVDSEGEVYVVDWTNRRVQKFGPEGEFQLMFGGEVNETKVEEVGATEAERNLCPVDPGDVCQAGAEGTGKGQFGEWKLGSYIAIDPKGTATATDDVIYVGDQGRVQEFDNEGHYIGDLPDPGEVLKKEGTVDSLAVNAASGELYLGFFGGNSGGESKPDVHKVSAAGEELCTIEAHDPSAVAVGSSGDVYVVDGATPSLPREIGRFNSKCGGKELLFGKELITTENENQFTVGGGQINPTGMATSSACGIEGADLLISNPDQGKSFVNLYGPAPQDFTPPCTRPPSVPPSIDAQFATAVGTDTATLRAQINPHFWPDTTYYVQYATAQCFEEAGWAAPCVKEQPAAPGTALTKEVIDAELTTKGVFLGAAEPLFPDTDYRYRFIAQSSGGGPVRGLGGTEAQDGSDGAFHTFPTPAPAKTDCPNQTLRSGPSAYLPDCRAYEMVSPPDKNNGDIGPPSQFLEQAASDGEALTFGTFGIAFAEPESAPVFDQYVAQRDPGGWSTASINTPRTNGSKLLLQEELVTRYKLFSEDLCSGWLLQDTDVPLVAGTVPRGVPNAYRRYGLHRGCGPKGYELLSTVFPPGYDPALEKSESRYYPQIQGFSADGKISVFRAAAALTADACAGSKPSNQPYQVYLSQEGTPGVAPTLVSVLPDGKAACAHVSVGTAQALSALYSSLEDSLYHAVSADGSRVFWTATNAPLEHSKFTQTGNSPGEIYLRLNATQPQSAFNNKGKCKEPEAACTLAVSQEAEAISGTGASRFLSAAADGSAAIFQTGEDLYEFDLAKALANEAPDTLIAHKVKGIIGTSADATRVYFVSTIALDAGATAGKPNVYLYRRGAGATFIATLGAADVTVGETGLVPSPIEIRPIKHTARVSPDGLHSVFVSSDPALAQSVASYDNTDASSGIPDTEVYLYDATANGGEGQLVCASCNPSGARPAGRLPGAGNDIWVAARIPGWTDSTHPGNALSDAGRRLFFESFESLVPRDTNGRQDVYEWERAASKDECLDQIGGELFEPASEGCLALISSGQSADDSEFVDASADGRDAFLFTNSSLLPQDIAFQDIYDARALGGFPPAPAPPAACEGEACQSPPEAPNDPTPASSSFKGAGNVVQASATKRKHHKKKRHHGKANHRRPQAGGNR